MRTSPESMRTVVILLMLGVFAALLLTGCQTTQPLLAPPTVEVTTQNGDIAAKMTGAENTQGGKLKVTRSENGAVAVEFVESGSQWFSVPDFSGENWTMYAGIGLILLGVVSIWIPFLAPAKFIIGGIGVAMLVSGSFMKREGFETLMFWLIAGGIVTVLAYLVFRYWSGLKEIVTGVEKSESITAKRSIHAETSHATDRIIDGLK